MSNINEDYQFILELNKLKLVFRNNQTRVNRKESTAEHSWSASMIVMVLKDQLTGEFGPIDELKAIKLTLIHDIVEIYAGDFLIFDTEAQKNKEALEIQALEQLVSLNPHFGQQLSALWYEFERKESIEAKIAKAADAICPIFQRLQSQHSYENFNVSLELLDKTKIPCFAFSLTFMTLYQKLKDDLISLRLIRQEALCSTT